MMDKDNTVVSNSQDSSDNPKTHDPNTLSPESK